MGASRSRQLIQSRDDEIGAARLILNGQDTGFELALFKRFNTIAKLRSKDYNSCFVLWHTNTLCSAGWLVCRYDENGGCPHDLALYCFEIAHRGTSKLDRHTQSHE